MRHKCAGTEKKKVLMLASVASMIDQFNMPNIQLLQEMGYEVHVACNYKEGNTCDERRLRELQKLLRQMHVVQISSHSCFPLLGAILSGFFERKSAQDFGPFAICGLPVS